MPVKPSVSEDQYIYEQERSRLLEKARQEQEAMAAAEKVRLKELHFMHCPKCGHKLLTEKQGETEVDVCPSCRGLWLDANELDAIIESTRKRGSLRSILRILGS